MALDVIDLHPVQLFPITEVYLAVLNAIVPSLLALGPLIFSDCVLDY